ncbi:MAG: hypothetical protein Q4F71_02025 [Paracoccus sp. (in: a-proteobacteria)]|nr:hypothetical protein [Paracoccus sp. (in: a-proteobacteria)]
MNARLRDLLRRLPWVGRDRLMDEIAQLEAQRAAESAQSAKYVSEIQRMRGVIDLLRGDAERRRAQVERIPGGEEVARLENVLAHKNKQLDRARAEIRYRTKLFRKYVIEGDDGQLGAIYGFDGKLAPVRGAAGQDQAVYRKTYVERFEVSGLEPDRACWLETRCLARLAATSGRAHFPRVLTLDPATPSVTLTHQGPTLDQLGGAQRAQAAARLRADGAAQIDAIARAMEAANVVNLDIIDNGRHLAISDEGRLSLIDFDIAALDQTPISSFIAQRLKLWQQRGGYDGTRELLAAQIAAFCEAAR